MCPWGAIVDKSFITDVVKMLKESENNQKYKVYAVVAPSISGQFSYAKLGQVITAIKKLGFHSVVEVALGADMVAYSEAAELAEKGFLTGSPLSGLCRLYPQKIPADGGAYIPQPFADGSHWPVYQGH